MRSPFGFHVIRRPPLAEVRATYAAGLARLVAAHDDSTHLALLVAQRHVVTEPDAPALVRGMFGDLFAARADRRWLVHYDGGGLRVQDAARWALALNPRQVALLPTASDPQVRQFLEAVTDRLLLLAEADSAGVQLSPQEWQAVRAQHDSSLSVLKRALGVAPADLGQAPPDVRSALAAAHVAAYLDRMFRGAVQFVGVPPFLASILRDSATWSISRRGVAAAAERADQLIRLPATPGQTGAPGSVRPDSSSHRSVP